VRKDHDVIILGSGAGALLLAAELSRSVHVLVLERRGLQRARSYGSTASGDSHEWLAPAKRATRGQEDVTIWDLERVATITADRIRSAGGEFLLFDSFRALRRQSMTEICANGRHYTARLIVDCMGYRSPFLATVRFGRIVDELVIQEGTIPVHSRRATTVHNIRLSAHAGDLEIFHLKESSYLSLVVRSSQLTRASDAMLDWRMAVVHAAQDDAVVGSAERSMLVPVLQINRSALDGFVVLQEPELQPDASACLSRAFESYRSVAASLRDCVAAGDVRRQTLTAHVQGMA
jgi:hypothetical protein